MNTSRFIVGCLAAAMALAARPAWSAAPPATVGAQLAFALSCQTSGDTLGGAEARRAAESYLSQARQAMTQGRFDDADRFIGEAEKLNPSFNVFHLGDTPTKARRDLAALRQSAPTGPASASPGAAIMPVPANSPGAAVANADRAAADKFLVEARRALAVGDVRSATELTAKAKAANVNYAFYEDSPDRVSAAIVRYNDLMERYGSDRGNPTFVRQHALLMLEQAEQLVAWREFDEAERLVVDAKRTYGSFGPFDPQPDTILARIAEARRQGPAGAQAAQVKIIERLPSIDGATPLGAAATGLSGMAPASVPTGTKTQVLDLVRRAREALARGDLGGAEALAVEAESMRVPDSEFAPQDDRAWLVLMQIQQQRMASNGAVQPATGLNTIAPPNGPFPDSQAVYDPAGDSTRNMPVAAQEPLTGALPPVVEVSRGAELFNQGEEALRRGDREQAVKLLREAYGLREEIDPLMAQRLQDHLQMLSQPAPAAGGGSLLDQATLDQQLAVRQVSAELGRAEIESRRLQENDPKRALAMLEQARKMVEMSQIDGASKDVLLRRVDRDIEEMRGYLTANAARIELEERNRAVTDGIARDDAVTIEIQEKLAIKVDEFNKLMFEQRYAEAEVLAKQMLEMAPNEPIVQQIRTQVRLVRNLRTDFEIRQAKEDGFVGVMQGVDQAATPFDDRNPLLWGDAKRWRDLSLSRGEIARRNRSRSPREIEIEQRLQTPVSCHFTETPLDQVMQHLAKLAQITIHLDPQGLAEEGVDTGTPITINIGSEISLRSVLNLVLEPLHLHYIIKDEVLKITSRQLSDSEVYEEVYNVADLVIPIPNFLPNSDTGLQGALNQAMAKQGYGGQVGFGGATPMPVFASNDASGSVDPRAMAQFGGGVGGIGGGMGGGMGGGIPNIGFPMGGGGTQTGMPQSFGGFGPGGVAGGSGADFDSLISLITETVEPETWSDVGGPGAIREFESNLSLVISQTQEVHEEIADLLAQLRRLQDLQVTIELRFITLSDRFFERIGIDFDFDLNDNIDAPLQFFGNPDPAFNGLANNTGGILRANGGPNRNVQDRDQDQSVTVGLTAPGVFSADLDVPFRQNSFDLAIPQFGNFQAAAGASMGFAILSDLEAFFFINAAQGDQRNNLLQAPKVTLFNGQFASVLDFSASPFVISVIPVVGDFAAALQPVIVVLPEGTSLTVQAVVSNDRRFVRMTMMPMFSQIGQVDTFTFSGSETTDETSSSEGPNDDTTARDVTKRTSRQGTTVQLPTLAVTSVQTTVSVPDGGTILLGGIKRLNEGRNEFGVPILNKLPYINRLFSNVGIGRDTSSLMMVVTPRIIIQEEEEALLGVQTPP